MVAFAFFIYGLRALQYMTTYDKQGGLGEEITYEWFFRTAGGC